MWLLYAKISCRSVENRRGRPQEWVTMCLGSSLHDNAYKGKAFKERSHFLLARIPVPGEVLESSLLFLLLLLLGLE